MKSVYQRKEWKEFSKKAIELKGENCSVCERHKDDVVLQIHHPYYEKGLMPWEYDIDELQLVCSGCHAREHKILEPQDGWILLETSKGHSNCQRQKSDGSICNQEIINIYQVYHPEIGHRIVGSTCVDHLTDESKEIVNDFNNVVKTCNNKILRVQGGDKVRGWKKSYKNSQKFKTKKSNGNCISATFIHERANIYKMVFAYHTADMEKWERIIFVNDYNGNAGTFIYSPLNNLIEFTFLFEQYLESKTSKKEHLQKYFAERINEVMYRMKWSFAKKR